MVYSCLEDKMFTARRGKGSFCNGEALQVSAQKGQRGSQSGKGQRTGASDHKQLLPPPSAITRSIIATEFGSNQDPEVVDKIFSSLRNILSIPVHGYGRCPSTVATVTCD